MLFDLIEKLDIRLEIHQVSDENKGFFYDYILILYINSKKYKKEISYDILRQIVNKLQSFLTFEHLKEDGSDENDNYVFSFHNNKMEIRRHNYNDDAVISREVIFYDI